MFWYSRFFLKMDKAGGDGGAGGSGGGTGGNAPDPAKEMEALKTQNADLMKRLEALEKGAKPPEQKPDDPDLRKKVQDEKDEADKKAAAAKNLESALKFNLSSADFLKNNDSLLPKTTAGIFAQAEKENYADAVEKAADIKVNIISEFFAVQSNLDMLTTSQKENVDQFLKLTKNVKQERVHQIYDAIFEPTLETLRKVKKAEALQKGLATPSNTEEAYQKRLVDLTTKHYIRERSNA